METKLGNNEPIKIKSFKDYIGQDQVLSLEELAAVQEAKKLKNAFMVKSDIPALDGLMEGYFAEAGELVVVSGLAKSGKSLFCQTLTHRFSNQGIITLWFSYELTIRQFLARFTGKLPDACLPAKMVGNSLLWIEDRIMEGKEKFGIRVCIIDHLHYLVDMEKLRNPSLEIGAILRGLKLLAVKHDVVMILVAHIGKMEAGKRPKATNMRDSSFLTQEPDTVLMVWRLKDNGALVNITKVSVELSRRTGVFEKTFKMEKRSGMLYEIERQKGDDDEEG